MTLKEESEAKKYVEEKVRIFAETFVNLRRESGRELKTYKEISKEIEESTGICISAVQLSKYAKMDKNNNMPVIYPKINIIMAIAKYYNVSIEYLLGLSETQRYEVEYKKGDKLFGLSDETMDLLSSMQRHKKTFLSTKSKNFSENDFVNFLIVNFAVKFEHAVTEYFFAEDEFNSYRELYMEDEHNIKDKYMYKETTVIDDYQALEQKLFFKKYILTQLVDQFLADLRCELTKKR